MLAAEGVGEEGGFTQAGGPNALDLQFMDQREGSW